MMATYSHMHTCDWRMMEKLDEEPSEREWANMFVTSSHIQVDGFLPAKHCEYAT